MATAQGADSVTRSFPALFRRGDVRPETVDPEKRTAEVVFTTGARVRRGGFWTEPYDEELSLDPKHVRMGRLNNGAPLLAAHDGSNLDAVIGVVESARLEKTRGVATVRFAKDEASERAFQKVKDGILQNISVGYRVHKVEKTEEDGKPTLVRAVDWEPYELSVVPMGADDGAGFRSSDDQALNPCVIVTRQEKTMPDQIEEKPTLTTTATSPTTTRLAAAVEEATREAKVERAAQAKERAEVAERAAEEATKQERDRVAGIRSIARRSQLGDAWADRLVEAGTSVETARAAAFDEVTRGDDEEITSHVRFEVGDDVREKFIRGAAASLYERAGLSQVIEDAKTNKRVGHLLRDVATDAGGFRGMRLIDLARQSLELRGVSTKGLYGERLVKAALEYRGDSGFNATGDFTVLLETAVNKVFLGRYATIPVTWPIWCARKSVQDFRTSTFYRPGAFSVLDTVTEQGEVKHKNIPDGAKATLTPATKGNIVGVTRKAIVNDDLGFLRDNASELGAAAARTIETDAWGLITAASGLGANAPDGVALFNAAHSNIGSTGAMSVATLDSLRVKMGLQKDPAGNAYLALAPAILLVPLELTGTAKTFNASAADPTDYKNALVFNKVNGLFREIIGSPFLSGSSATRHYALADPNVGPVFAVGFIDGQEAPTLTSEQSFQYDGLQMKVIIDYGTAVIDYRGAATCAGA